MEKQKTTEIIAGITTFLTMVYIVVVNPSILATPGTGMPFNGVLTATVTLTVLMTLLMGLYAQLPMAVAPGMGINAFFTFTIILRNRVPWPIALGMVFWSGVIFLVCSMTPARTMIAMAVPRNLRIAASVGIGLFLTFIGLKNTGIVAADPVTFVRLGQLSISTLITVIGMGSMAFLLSKKSPWSFLVGMALITGLEALQGKVQLPSTLWSWPDFDSIFFKADIFGALKLALLPSIISIFFTDLFDSLSTFMGCAQAGGLVDSKGLPKNLRQGLIVDAWATLGAGLAGTSSGTAFVESAAGIEVGGRTGLTAVVVALCFIPCYFIAPLAGVVPAHATGSVLVLVGALMFREVKHLALMEMEELVPAFLTLVLIPLTFSITQGLLWGFVSHVSLYTLAGRKQEISPTLWILAAISVGLLVLDGLSN